MVVIERASTLSSSSSSRKTEKQSRSRENDLHELLLKGKSVKRASSFSSPLSPSMKRKEKSASCLKETKPIQRASSFSSSYSPSRIKEKEKEKKNVSMSNNELARNEKPVPRTSSLLSCSSVDSPKKMRSPKDGHQVRKEKRPDHQSRKSSALIKSKIKELGPICKKRKDVLDSIQAEDDIDVYFDKQIDEDEMINPDDCFWLSSGSMSPQELGLFMTTLDHSLDEWVISFIPSPSGNPSHHVDGSKAAVKTAVLSEPVEENEVVDDVKECPTASTDQNIDSSSTSSSSLALSTYTNNSAFWNLDRTGVWVSLINLEGDDSKLISVGDSESEDLDPDFPSPTYEGEANWDSCSSDVGVSSSARSTQESSHSDWSSDLLSDSVDWDVESDDPIFWPCGLDSGWDQTLETFSVSPRKGTFKSSLDLAKDGIVSPGSIKFRLHHGRRENSKEGMRRRILFVSGLTASKIIEFKKGCRKKFAAAGARGTSNRRSKIGKRAGRYNRRVPPILETDLEGISPKDTPTKQTEEFPAVNFNSDLLSESEDWGDEMDSDGPLVWPSDQKQDWNVTCDFLNISPRKNAVNFTNFGSPKGGFTVSSSIRLKFQFRADKKAKTKPGSSILGLGASKSLKFKPGSHKTTAVSRRRPVLKATPLKLSPSFKSMVVIVPSKRATMVKPAEFKHSVTRINANHGKRIRAMPLKIGKSVEQFLRLVSVNAVNKKFPEGELTSGHLPIETVMGLSEFDGHEGVDMDFEETQFSFEEYMRD